METILRVESLANGLTVTFYDHSNRYFGDYHRVCIEARCPVAVTADTVARAGVPGMDLQQARALLGETTDFVKKLEKMGVSGNRLETVKNHLMDEFLKGAAAYLAKAEFPARLVARQLTVRRGRRRPFSVIK